MFSSDQPVSIRSHPRAPSNLATDAATRADGTVETERRFPLCHRPESLSRKRKEQQRTVCRHSPARRSAPLLTALDCVMSVNLPARGVEVRCYVRVLNLIDVIVTFEPQRGPKLAVQRCWPNSQTIGEKVEDPVYRSIQPMVE